MTSIALIGPGGHGTAIATLFAAHGVDVTLYHRRPEQAERAASAVRLTATATVTIAASSAHAVEGTDVVVIATLWDQPQLGALRELDGRLDGKIVVDVSNPIDVTPEGITRRHPEAGSAGQHLARMLPEGTGQVKAFSNLDTALIATGADHEPLAVLPFLADSDATAARIRPYLRRTGWQPWYAGPIERSAEMEIGGLFNNPLGRWGRSALVAEEMLALDGPERGVSP